MLLAIQNTGVIIGVTCVQYLGVLVVTRAIIIYLLCLNVGCASLTARPYACENGNSFALDKFNKRVAGYVGQVGDCALSSTLRIEIGGYYRSKKYLIDDAVWKQSGEPKNPPPEEVQNFSRAFNCTAEADKAFNEMLIHRQEEIFGEKWTTSERQVTLRIEKLIKENSDIKPYCSL